MLEVQKERDNAIYVRNELLKKHVYLQSRLFKERINIKTWTNSRKTTQNILERGCWREGLGHSNKKNGKEEVDTAKLKFTEKASKPKINPVNFVPTSENPNSEK